MFTVKFDIVIAVLKTFIICTRTTLEDSGMISVRVLDDHINKRINLIQYYLTKGLIIFWNWILELKMDKRYLYNLFFYFFKLFNISLTKSIIWKPEKILFPVIGLTWMYCKNWLSNGYFCGGKRFFYTL